MERKTFNSEQAHPRHEAGAPLPPSGSTSQRRGFHPPSENPYAQALKSGAYQPLGKVEQGFIPEDIVDERQGFSLKKLSRKQKYLALAVVVLLVVLGVVGYMNRPVEIMVNGERRTFNVGTTAQEVLEKTDLKVQAGNLVSVSKHVLKTGQGYPYTLKVNGKKYQGDVAKDYRIQPGDNLEFSRGANRMESYATKTVKQEPRLVMEGTYGSLAYISKWGYPTTRQVITGNLSHETVDGKILQEGSDCVIQLVNANPKDNKKVVALTFDDGPSAYTAKYLDILKKYNVKATFFALGQNVEARPKDAKRIVDEGHQLASHSYDHKDLTKVSQEEMDAELTKTFKAIQSATGVKTTVMRPPYGAFNQKAWLKTDGKLSLSVLWTKDSQDWRQPGVQTIVANSINGIRPGDIILMHDGGVARDQDLEALPLIIEKLQEQGYTFVTIDQLMQTDGRIPEKVATGDATMPEKAVWPKETGNY